MKSLAAHESFDLARQELVLLNKFHTDNLAKFGSLSEKDQKGISAAEVADEEAISEAETALADKVEHEWPRNLWNWLGFRQGTPRIVEWTWSAVVAAALLFILYKVLDFIRFLRRRTKFADLGGVIPWTVSSILDDTKQSAAGAIMDALNVDYNPLFDDLPVSSLLAVPVLLLPPKAEAEAEKRGSDPEISVWRDFMFEFPEQKRGLLRSQLEDIDKKKFAKHRFMQVKVFDEFNLKVGGLETAPGTVIRNLRRWWEEGWPSVTGTVTIERCDDVSFASVRLIGNIGDLRKPDYSTDFKAGKDATLEELFSGERTISVFASTEIDQYTDAVALAAQRAAFRFFYRLLRPGEANLAIAASSYRQGVRLLATTL